MRWRPVGPCFHNRRRNSDRENLLAARCIEQPLLSIHDLDNVGPAALRQGLCSDQSSLGELMNLFDEAPLAEDARKSAEPGPAGRSSWSSFAECSRARNRQDQQAEDDRTDQPKLVNDRFPLRRANGRPSQSI
jgi:hypothetical protein